MDKQRLHTLAIEALLQELEALRRAAEATRAAATHEEAKPENDKDTRALEQSYLARGQAQRVEEAAEALTHLRFMELRAYGPDDAVGLAALVLVAIDDDERRYFVVPAAGGMKVSLDGVEIQLLSAKSPLGAGLVGRTVGDAFELTIGGKRREYELLEIE